MFQLHGAIRISVLLCQPKNISSDTHTHTPSHINTMFTSRRQSEAPLPPGDAQRRPGGRCSRCLCRRADWVPLGGGQRRGAAAGAAALIPSRCATLLHGLYQPQEGGGAKAATCLCGGTQGATSRAANDTSPLQGVD